MTEIAATTSASPQPASLEAGRSLWADARRRIVRDRSAMICLAVIALYVLAALGGVGYNLAAEWSHGKIPAFEDTADFSRTNQAPSLRSWRDVLGTDWAGRSVLLKTILGAKVSITVGFMSNILAVPLGMLLGAVAGYYGRWLDNGIVWVYSTLASVPGIILLIALKYAFHNVHLWGMDLGGLSGLCLALAVTSWIGTCRLVRAETMKIRELDYVLAARATGRGSFSTLFRHVLPNVVHIGIINFSLGFVGAVVAEVMLSYLGLGVEVGTPSWGTMINSARLDLISGRWWELSSAVGAMFFLVLALNIFGDRLRDALDPRLKNV